MAKPVFKLRNIILLLFRTSVKTALFISFFSLAAMLTDASKFISYETSSNFSEWLYGFASQENFDDLWFYTDVSFSLLAAAVCYSVVMFLIRKWISSLKESL